MDSAARFTTLGLGSLAVALWLASAGISVAQNDRPEKAPPANPAVNPPQVKPVFKVRPPKGQSAPAKPGAPVLDVHGEITNQDGNDPVRNHPAKNYSIKLKMGKTYQIDMVSGVIDSYLRLVDAGGKELAHDDDGGDGLNARLVFPCTKDGSYKIVSTTFNGGTGTFQLTVSEAATAKTVITKLMLKEGAVQVDSQLTNQDSKDPTRLRSFAKVYEFPMQAGRTYQIDMTSNQLDSYLRLLGPDGKEVAHDDDGGEGLNARLVYNCTNNGTYRIIATTFVGGTGAFTLSVRLQ